MNKPIYPTIVDRHQVIGPRRIVEVDRAETQRVIEIFETTGETISDETYPSFPRTCNVIPFAASLRRVG